MVTASSGPRKGDLLMARKKANGEGNIRKRDNGTWEGRATIGGKSKSVYGKTQAEVRRKLTEILSSVDNGTYIPDTGMTVAQWLEIWQNEYCRNIKRSTAARYESDVRIHIVPAIGKLRLSDLKPFHIQRLYNQAQDNGLSDKSIHNLHGTLHKALQQAVDCELVKSNVCDKIKLPTTDAPKKEMRPLKDKELPTFLRRVSGHKMGELFFVAVFTGMRESEIIGLSWDCIDFDNGKINLYRQLSRGRRKGEDWTFTTLKNKENRTFAPPKEVFEVLQKVKKRQLEWRLKCGESWNNKENLVFTNESGTHLSMYMVYKYFKQIMKEMGLPDVRFHDLRHH